MRRKDVFFAGMALCIAAVLADCKNMPDVPPQQPEPPAVEMTVPVVNEDSLREEAERKAKMEEEKKVIEEQVAHVYEQVDVAYCTSPVGMSIDLDGLFCTDDWVQTVDAVRAKDAQHQDEPGFSDIDYWVMNQEVAGAIRADSIAVDSLDLDEGRAHVSLHLRNGGNDTPVLLDMLLVDDTWRIDEFTLLQPDTFAWKASMKEYMEEGVKKETVRGKGGQGRSHRKDVRRHRKGKKRR